MKTRTVFLLALAALLLAVVLLAAGQAGWEFFVVVALALGLAGTVVALVRGMRRPSGV